MNELYAACYNPLFFLNSKISAVVLCISVVLSLFYVKLLSFFFLYRSPTSYCITGISCISLYLVVHLSFHHEKAI